MKNKLPINVSQFMQKFIDANFQIYIVGGAVRDLLLGKNNFDWDFTTDATPDEILKLFPDGFYDNKFGTVGIPTVLGGAEERSQASTAASETSEDAPEIPRRQDPKPKVFEVTTMRKEGIYKDHRHPIEVSWTDKLDEDLARRDFTVNAMALSVDGHLTDLYHGQQDLELKKIKAVGNPDQRFQEDALRMLKAFRMISQLEFEIEKNTFDSIFRNKFLISDIAWERIRDELFKLLSGANPYLGLLKLREAGILDLILPEIEKAFGIVQEGPKHDRVYDVGEHSFLTMKHTPSNDPLVKFAALLHDVGKVETMKIQQDGNVTFYNHDVVGGRVVLEIAKRFNLSKKQTDKLFKLVRWHLFTVDENQTDSAIRRFIKNVGVENLEDMMALREGDRIGGGTQKPTSWRLEKFKDRIQQVLQKPFSISDLKINGEDVMKTLNIPPSRQVGEILNKLFQEVLEDSSKNNREYLLSRIRQIN